MSGVADAGLVDAGARDLITGREPSGLATTLFVEAGAGSGKTSSLVDRVVALVGHGTPLRQIAAITFTERAAAQLRDRIRTALEQCVAADSGDAHWRAALDQLDAAAISTLHAFAQRILTERPLEAGLPPNVEVLDEVASEVAFEERWLRLRARLLDDDALERTLLLALAAGLRLTDIRGLVGTFDDNWDLVSQGVPWPATDPPAVNVTALLDALEEICRERDLCGDSGDKMLGRLDQLSAYADALRAAADEYALLAALTEAAPSFRAGNCGRRGNWPPDRLDRVRAGIAALAVQRDRIRESVVEACAQRLAVAVRDDVLAAAEQRRAQGRLEFHDLLVLARELLRGPEGRQVRQALAARYRRLLLDEFQDTDPIQVELAVLLASDDPDAGAKDWQDVAVRPGALFFVGDPKQSIYRFRRADIGLFLRARDAFAASAEPTRLTTNFRTAPGVLGWVNHVFGRLITFEQGAQPEYQPLAAAPGRHDAPQGPGVGVLGSVEHTDAPDAQTLREREAATVADTVVAAVAEGWSVRDERRSVGDHGWHAARPGDITILLPTRTSLSALEDALEARGVAYRAETSSLVYSTPEVREVFAALRVVADPSDELALVTALRSRLFGCGDDDLLTFRRRHRGRWDPTSPLPPDLPEDHPVGESLRFLRGLWVDSGWLGPSELLDRIVRERRLLELGLADGRPRDLWRRLRFVIDQSREWSEAVGGTLREYLRWAALQSSESSRVAETVLPETDEDSARIMTIHGAKGLEFPITVVSGLTTGSRGPSRRVRVVWPPGEPVGMRFGSALSTRQFEAYQPLDEQLDYHERLRLLYVACTRAEDHLVVSLHRKTRKQEPEELRALTNAELLARCSTGAPGGQPLDPPTQAVTPTAPTSSREAGAWPPNRSSREAGAWPPNRSRRDAPPLPDLDDWQDERARLLARGDMPRTVAATGLAALRAGGASRGTESPDPDPGLAKEPRDLELPPWVKGRYGTAIGRAVHGVLQTIDLATGSGLDDAVAAQSAAEGVTGREGDVAALVRAALGAPAVREAAGAPDRWRETYVAAPLDVTGTARTLEGYVDLLYRTSEGLVIVDYKTAASADDLDKRAAAYRLQGAAYALALASATGERVARCVFVFLTPTGAHERTVADLDGAIAEVQAVLGRQGTPGAG